MVLMKYKKTTRRGCV